MGSDKDNLKVIFICGALRSGTSLLHLMLNAHPQISNPGEFDFLFDGINEISDEPDLESYISFLQHNRIFCSRNLVINTNCKTYSDLLHDMIDQLSSDLILCLNIHRNFDYALHYFPDARFIHIVRDPRDVANSSIPMGWAGHIYFGVDHWIETEYSWNRLMVNADQNSSFQFRYENLISDSHKELSLLCEFLQLPYDKKMLDYHETSTYTPPDITLIEQWRSKQQGREIELVEWKAQELMLERGYENFNQRPRGPSLWEWVSLSLSNKVYKYKFSIRRYGLLLAVMYKLIVIFPWLPSAGKYRQRIHQVQIKHLR